MIEPDRIVPAPATGRRLGGLRLAPVGTDPLSAWYEHWRKQNGADRVAEEVERARMRREIRWMTGLIAAWSLVMGAAAALAIWMIL